MKKTDPYKYADLHPQRETKDSAVQPVERQELLDMKNGSEFRGFASEWIYHNIQEATVSCRKLLLIFFSLLSYALLFTLSTPIENLFLGRNLTMPFVGIPIPIYLYIFFFPAIIIGYFIYTQLYLHKVNRMVNSAIVECKNKNPKCEKNNPKNQPGDSNNTECTFNQICDSHENRIYPWLFIFSRFSTKKLYSEKSHEIIIRSLQSVFVFCSLWLYLPFTLFVVSLFMIKTHEPIQFYFLLVMIVLGNGVVIYFRIFLHRVGVPASDACDEDSSGDKRLPKVNI
jgi:hypothetical protein